MDNYIDRRSQLALDLINSYDPYLAEPETLRTPRELQAFLEHHDVQAVQAPQQPELTAVYDLRTRLRQAFKARHSEKAAGILNTFLDTAAAKPMITDAFGVVWQVVDEQPLLTRLSAEAALGLADVFQTFGPDRVKACAAAPCQEVFVDTSRNRSRRFCGDRCANRYHVAAFREKQ